MIIPDGQDSAEQLARLIRERSPAISERVTAFLRTKWKTTERVGYAYVMSGQAKIERYLKEFANSVESNRILDHEVTADSISFAEKYLRIAEVDLQRAMRDFRGEDYPMAVYFLQQGIEKTSTAVALSTGAVPAKIRPFKGHDTPGRFLSMFKTVMGGYLLDVNSFAGQTDYGEKRKAVNVLIYNEGGERLFNWNSFQIDRLLDVINKFRAVNLDVDEAEEATKSILVETIPEAESYIDEFDFTERYRPAEAVTSLYVLGAITYLHENETRYPTERGQPDDYQVGHSLIVHFRKMHTEAKRSHNIVTNFIR